MTTPTVDLTRAPLNIKSTQGDDVGLPFTIRENGAPANLTGRTYRCQLRRALAATAFVAVTVDVTNAATGVLVLRILGSVTGGLSGGYLWDFEQTTSGVPRTLLGGTWTFEPQVSRP